MILDTTPVRISVVHHGCKRTDSHAFHGRKLRFVEDDQSYRLNHLMIYWVPLIWLATICFNVVFLCAIYDTLQGLPHPVNRIEMSNDYQ